MDDVASGSNHTRINPTVPPQTKRSILIFRIGGFLLVFLITLGVSYFVSYTYVKHHTTDQKEQFASTTSAAAPAAKVTLFAIPSVTPAAQNAITLSVLNPRLPEAKYLGHHTGKTLIPITLMLPSKIPSGAPWPTGSLAGGSYKTGELQKLTGAEPGQVSLVQQWLTAQGLRILPATGTSVEAEGTTLQLEKAFYIVINDYSLNGQTFYSTDRSITVPKSLNLVGAAGFDDMIANYPATR